METTPDEQLSDLTVKCGTHGELEVKNVDVGFDGRIHCTFCSMNQEMGVDTDSTVEVGL